MTKKEFRKRTLKNHLKCIRQYIDIWEKKQMIMNNIKSFGYIRIMNYDKCENKHDRQVYINHKINELLEGLEWEW